MTKQCISWPAAAVLAGSSSSPRRITSRRYIPLVPTRWAPALPQHTCTSSGACSVFTIGLRLLTLSSGILTVALYSLFECHFQEISLSRANWPSTSYLHVINGRMSSVSRLVRPSTYLFLLLSICTLHRLFPPHVIFDIWFFFWNFAQALFKNI
jgi:hypothetical protein